MRLPLFALCIAVLASPGNAADLPVQICNDLTVELADINAMGQNKSQEVSERLGPGECASVSGLAVGKYTLIFIERSGSNSASCQKEITVVPKAVIRLTPDDNARCLY